MIKEELNKDVFAEIDERLEDGERVIFFHGCNAQGAMGSGIAEIVIDKWREEVYKPYSLFCNHNSDEELMGRTLFTYVDRGKDLVVANGITQRYYGKKGYAEAPQIKKCIESIENFRTDEIVIAPRVGCGLGKLDWEQDVKELFEASSLDWTICYI